MPEGVRVDVRDAYVISACNTPGGPVHEWRNKVEEEALVRCFETAPVNDELNTLHDPTRPPIGDFQRSFVTRRQGNAHRIGFQIENFSDHAIYSELGRSASTKFQTFSWTGWHGDIRSVGGPLGGGTRGRDGAHTLRNAINAVMMRETGGSYTPLV